MKKARKTSKALRPAGLKIKVKTGIKAGGITHFARTFPTTLV